MLIIALVLIAGCASLPERAAFDEEGSACLDHYRSLDALIVNSGRHDAGAHRLADFPWLRSTRFLASFADELGDDTARWSTWLNHLARTDLDARRYELANVTDQPPRSDDVERRLAPLAACAATLNDAIVAQPAVHAQVLRQAEVPDEYRTVQRWLGLYPITQLFVLSGVGRLHAEQRAALEGSGEAVDGRHMQGYLATDAFGDAAHRRRLDIPRDVLGIPLPDQRQLAALFQRHAPLWRIEQRTPADRVGRPKLDGEHHAVVDVDRPTEYRFVTYTRFAGEVRLQLNYLIWFPERPKESRFDLFAGHLDGAIWRVTLAADGEPLAGESLHVCGCYYMVFPGAGVRPRQDGLYGGEPIFVGPALPPGTAGQRIRLTREASTHYLVGVATGDAQAAQALEVRTADELRSLPGPDGRDSLYGRGGLVPGTQRAERWLLWPMGVPSPGAMRQPGRHAIAFVGRRHFDQADLLELSLTPADAGTR